MKQIKGANMKEIRFLNEYGDFTMEQPENYSYLYFPIAGENNIKSSVTPNLGGDSKIDQNTFLLEPVSAENLHNNRSSRNFWCTVEGVGSWSITGQSAEEEFKKFSKEQDKSTLFAGFMWHKIKRISSKYQLEAKITSFVPLDDNLEIMQVEICNKSQQKQTIIPTASIPIYGRSADNMRDHRHVTSLLHRIKTCEYGVLVKPTLSFDERGHHQNETIYFVCGVTGNGEKPISFYPIVEEFIGEGGSYTNPLAVKENKEGVRAGECREGKEAMGGIRFPKTTLEPNQKVSYTILLGVATDSKEIDHTMIKYDSKEKVENALQKVKKHYQEKVNVKYHTNDDIYDNYLRWISFQPILRRMYGCSFLPYHDYGKGGRGWRDLWQDCLALIIMNPSGVREMIISNFAGVRIDGTNATIIGEKQGEFVADRNNITRVWMDHGFWPFLTTKLYIDQTGDIEIMNVKIPYFKDKQIFRGTRKDEKWNDSYGMKQKCLDGSIYYGTVLEHLLLQNLSAFYEVGDHNHIRMRGADWNDALDMAEEKGESVAFTCAYAGNFKDLANYLRDYKRILKTDTVSLSKEIVILLSNSKDLYESPAKKQELLQSYCQSCMHNISGGLVRVLVDDIIKDLNRKALWMMEHIRTSEWVCDSLGNGWFNGYYDNQGRKVEGIIEKRVRMMLTGQVFAIMSGTAQNEQIKAICESADTYLYQREIGGYRLNTNFYEKKFDLGRMFGFAYGEKENGAVFSHMTVMYANALYKQGFVKEGYKALQSLGETSMDFNTSRMYPGIPEYFNASGRGMYSYLTGAASWYMLTMITQVFGVHGEMGNLIIEPKLVSEQFDQEGKASLTLWFGKRQFEIIFYNPQNLTYSRYKIERAVCNETNMISTSNCKVSLAKEELQRLGTQLHKIEVFLSKNQR